MRLEVIEVFDGITGEMRGYPKSKRRRSVPLSPELAALLQEWLDRHPPKSTCGKPHRGGRCQGGLLITGPQGAPLDPHNFEERQWRDAAIRAGFYVEDPKAVTGRRKRRITVHPHDLRHTYASRLVQQGVPMDTVQRLLGHEDPQTTARYARFRDGDGWDDVRGALSTSVTAARAASADVATDVAEPGSNPVQQGARQRRLRAL
jgi:integrase